MKAGDFRRAIERVFTVPSTADAATGGQFFEGIVGVADCERHWRTCDLSMAILLPTLIGFARQDQNDVVPPCCDAAQEVWQASQT